VAHATNNSPSSSLKGNPHASPPYRPIFEGGYFGLRTASFSQPIQSFRSGRGPFSLQPQASSDQNPIGTLNETKFPVTPRKQRTAATFNRNTFQDSLAFLQRRICQISRACNFTQLPTCVSAATVPTSHELQVTSHGSQVTSHGCPVTSHASLATSHSPFPAFDTPPLRAYHESSLGKFSGRA